MMKKIIIFFVTAMMAMNVLSAQSLADGIKNLNFQKTKTSLAIFKKLYDANPKDPRVVYWYGQSLIDGEGDPTPAQIKDARTLYQKALTDGVNDPWIWVGMGHLDILDHVDLNAVKQKFEQAITASKTKKGENPDILDAIGRANADEGIKYGDPVYAIDKLKRAAELNKTNPDIYNNMGLCYRKMGSENGGPAVQAFLEALARDPKNVVAMFQIGKIYASQNNKEALEKYFTAAIAADPTFPPAYLALFKYYADKDVDKAKNYLDNFLKYADKDPENDYFFADYLFRAKKYDESLAKGKEIEASVGLAAVPRLNILYAYDYDRLGDSVKAKEYLEKFFAAAPATLIEPDHYSLAVKVFSQFPGSEATAVSYLQKAIDNDTSVANKIAYCYQAADSIYGKAKMYADQVTWLQKAIALKGAPSEADYYKLTLASLNSKDYPKTMEIAKKYIAAFPDKPQGYLFNVKAAKSIDSVTAIEPLNQQDSFYMRSPDSVANKKYVYLNLYFTLRVYADKKEYRKALDVTDQMIELYPQAGDENKYAVDTRELLRKALAGPTRTGAKSSGANRSSNSTPRK